MVLVFKVYEEENYINSLKSKIVMQPEDHLFKERKEKLKELESKGINPYPQEFEKKDDITTILSTYDKLKSEEKAKKKVQTTGRMMLKREMGKASFANIQDQTGRIQIYVTLDLIKDEYQTFKKLDIGDIIGVKGTPFRTKKGELSIEVESLTLLSKSLRPLPEKWAGLKDVETRYRQRYLDLIVNPEVRETFVKRAKIIKTIREYLNNKGFLEVETPLLQPTYGGASAKPFTTHLNALDMNIFLSISPELYLKRLIVGGFEKIYTICKNFRNEGIDTTHNPEFTMLEFYHAYATYETLMEMTEELIPLLVKTLYNSYTIKIGDKEFNFKPPFKRVAFRDLILEHTQIDIDTCRGFEALKNEIVKRKIKNVNIEQAKSYGSLMDELYKRVCRPNILQPTFLTHYPVEMIALAKRNPKDPTKINSFQLLIDGAEIVKAYDELNDPIDQRARMEEQQRFLKKGNEEAMPLDEDFLHALEIGMPPTAGYGLGIDRLTMFLDGKESIKDVILFPFMKSMKEN